MQRKPIREQDGTADAARVDRLVGLHLDDHASGADVPSRLGLQPVHGPYGEQSSLPEPIQQSEKRGCPYPDCGSISEDLEAHMLTHGDERPEKCPITSCEYHRKGFAREFDRNRHTLTHYKGTILCGFCPRFSSAKSFNRADVFNRHLRIVHGVEQAPPWSRKTRHSFTSKKLVIPVDGATGMCFLCSAAFRDAQEYCEHMDGCVVSAIARDGAGGMSLRIDRDILESIHKHMTSMWKTPISYSDDDMFDDTDEDTPTYIIPRTSKTTSNVDHVQ